MNSIFKRLPASRKILFIKQLAVLTRAGVPLYTALTILKKQDTSQRFGVVMDQVIFDVENGQALATALGKNKGVFGDMVVRIIAVGEVSGTLSDNLEYLALSLKKHQALRRKITGAAVYPAFIALATLAITLALTLVVFPKILPVFKSLDYQLPWTTRFLMFINYSLLHYWVIIVGVIFAIAGAFIFLLKHSIKFRLSYEVALLKVPFVGQVLKMYHTASISRTVGLLMHASLGVAEVFTVTSESTKNPLYKQQLLKIAGGITQGERISTGIRDGQNLFPLMVLHMVEVGEATGRLPETFFYLADTYEQELDDAVKNLSTAVEPILLMLMGLLVGFVAISIITPIYGITQHLTPK